MDGNVGRERALAGAWRPDQSRSLVRGEHPFNEPLLFAGLVAFAEVRQLERLPVHRFIDRRCLALARGRYFSRRLPIILRRRGEFGAMAVRAIGR